MSQFWPVAHVVELHWHTPPLQSGVPPPHAEQVPLVPHAAGVVPAAQVPVLAPAAMEQQPPLHVPVQVAPQAPFTHASFAGQSLSAVQTHLPAALHVGAPAPQTAHAPLAPHAAAVEPNEHVPEVAPAAIEQQPPLHVPVHVVPHTPLTHAWFVGHWLSELQPHGPVARLGKHTGEVPLQVTHVFPEPPQAFGSFPPTQVPLLPLVIWQHPPVHGTLAEHAVSQVCAELHATFVAQSVLAELHPHVPPNPLDVATQAVPTLAPTQLWHAPPVSPHAACDVPIEHVPGVAPLAPEQHPPLHIWVESLQAVVHELVLGSQAIPSGQSAATLQPHDPVATMHAAPASAATQLTHAVPGAPHAVAVSGEAHFAPLQQVPLHAWLAEQVVVHACELRSHASPAAQSLLAEHPVVPVSPPPPSGDPPSSGIPPSMPASPGVPPSESVLESPAMVASGSDAAPSGAPPSIASFKLSRPSARSHPDTDAAIRRMDVARIHEADDFICRSPRRGETNRSAWGERSPKRATH